MFVGLSALIQSVNQDNTHILDIIMIELDDQDGFNDYEEISFEELKGFDLTSLPEGVSYHVFENNFPDCSISRNGDKLEIRIEEHVYTKYWFHKYHAAVFADAMIKAIKRLRIEGVPFSEEELDNEDEVHLFIRWTLTEPAMVDSNTLYENINLALAVFLKEQIQCLKIRIAS